MHSIFKPIAHSWVAINPQPIGVVEFLGGALFGSVPIVSYNYFLRSLYEVGYTVITLPFRFGLDHQSIAESLLAERDEVLEQLGDLHQAIPRFWVGHSLGCKYIVLLEAAEKIKDQPSLLIAPDISDTKEAVPIPPIAEFLERVNCGVQPTREKTRQIIENSDWFNFTALISFEQDYTAGRQSDSPNTSDVALFINEIERKKGRRLLKQEIPGSHEEIVGLQVSKPDGSFSFVDLDLTDGIFEDPKVRRLEPLAIEFLNQLKLQMDKMSLEST